jgi:two-component system, NarL family, sensor histidine kinase UhpB
MPSAFHFASARLWLLRWLLAPLLSLIAPPASAVNMQFDRALSVHSDAAQFPEDAAATEIALPDDWAATRRRAEGPVWYRIRFAAPTSTGAEPLYAFYIKRACTNLEVHLNGSRLYSGGRMTEPVTRNCYYPQLVSVPATLLRSINVLDIKIVGMPLHRVSARQRAGGLSPVNFGDYETLAPFHEKRLFWSITLPSMVGAAMLVLSVLMLAMGWLNRRESHMTYFGLMSLGWAVLSARLWLRESPVPGPVIEWLVCAIVPLVAACAVLFLLRYAGLVQRAIDMALIVQCAMVPASLALAGPNRVFVLANAWYVLLALEVLIAAWVYLWYAWRAHRKEFWIMVVLMSLVSLIVVIELAVQHGKLTVPGIHVLHFVVPVTFIAVGLRLTQVYAKALGAAETGRNTLETRVAEITADIERNFAQLAEMRVEQVTARERKRIAADLHDDLGAKLLTIVHTSESDRISTLAREALEEMRLSVRGLTGKPVRLTDALGDWRAEVMLRLGQTGISAEWTSPAEELPQTLPARAYVQTTRILREAISNIIKHSGASRCTVTGAVKRGDFVLTIQDNGNGIPMELDGQLDRGHGMASMKHRAKQLQGQCLVESGPGYGTVIRLTLPL